MVPNVLVMRSIFVQENMIIPLCLFPRVMSHCSHICGSVVATRTTCSRQKRHLCTGLNVLLYLGPLYQSEVPEPERHEDVLCTSWELPPPPHPKSLLVGHISQIHLHSTKNLKGLSHQFEVGWINRPNIGEMPQV
jgi:hypothetical protein